MTDIIQHAKKALEGATPGPWVISGEFDPEYPELQGAPQEKGSFVYTPILCENVLAHLLPRDVELIAAAPEHAKALAEETWEYGVEYKYLTNRGTEWRLDPSAGWHKYYQAAEREASAHVQFRIVRRRVSPVEVCCQS